MEQSELKNIVTCEDLLELAQYQDAIEEAAVALAEKQLALRKFGRSLDIKYRSKILDAEKPVS